MTQRTPTLWRSNPSIEDGIDYSDSATAYSDSNTAYSTPEAGTDQFGKTPSSWTPTAKSPTQFFQNSDAITNLYPYDSASKTYDSASDTYDGVVSGQDFTTTKKPTSWSPL